MQHRFWRRTSPCSIGRASSTCRCTCVCACSCGRHQGRSAVCTTVTALIMVLQASASWCLSLPAAYVPARYQGRSPPVCRIRWIFINHASRLSKSMSLTERSGAGTEICSATASCRGFRWSVGHPKRAAGRVGSGRQLSRGGHCQECGARAGRRACGGQEASEGGVDRGGFWPRMPNGAAHEGWFLHRHALGLLFPRFMISRRPQVMDVPVEDRTEKGNGDTILASKSLSTPTQLMHGLSQDAFPQCLSRRYRTSGKPEP